MLRGNENARQPQRARAALARLYRNLRIKREICHQAQLARVAYRVSPLVASTAGAYC